MTDGKKPETPRTDALKFDVVIDGEHDNDDRIALEVVKAEDYAKLEASLIAAQKELAFKNQALDTCMEACRGSVVEWRKLKDRAEKAEQALALRGEPVAKEKIKQIAEECRFNLGRYVLSGELGDKARANCIESAILAGIALYAAPISGERDE